MDKIKMFVWMESGAAIVLPEGYGYIPGRRTRLYEKWESAANFLRSFAHDKASLLNNWNA